MNNKSETANKQIAKAAGVIMLAFILSNIVGLVRQILVSRTFGTNQSLDAFYAAATFPDLLFNLLAGGALGSAFIPTFTGFLANNDRKSAWKLASSITNLMILSMSIVSLLAAFLAPTLVSKVIFIFKPGLDPALKNLTIDLLRIILIAPTIFGISGLVMGILNTHQKFWMPALAPVFNWIGWILGLFFLVPRMGIQGLAWGYVLGAILHLLIQIPGLLKLKEIRFDFSFGLNNPAVREVGRLMAPRLLGVAAVQINFVINAMIASGQGEGSLSAINVARMVMTMPLFVIAQAIATAALPTFSAQVANGKQDEMSASLAATLRGVLLLAVPASVGLIILRQPVITMLFQRGQFDSRSTEMVVWALLWYTAGLVGHAVVEILSRAFYALHDTKTPVTIGIAAMVLNAVFSFGFPLFFIYLGWMPHGGLALANSLATALEAVLLLLFMSKRVGGIHGRAITDGLIKYCLASLGMGIIILSWIQVTVNLNPWLVVLGGISFGGLVYGSILLLLNVSEIKLVISVLKSRFHR